MKHDVILAIIIGFLLGGMGALIATNLPNILKQTTNSDKYSSLSPTPIIKTITENITLEMEQPQDQSISEGETVDLVGRAKQAVSILFESDLEAKSVEATADGNFRTKMNLSEGANTIYITAYDDKDGTMTKILTVFYTNEKL